MRERKSKSETVLGGGGVRLWIESLISEVRYSEQACSNINRYWWYSYQYSPRLRSILEYGHDDHYL